MMDWIRAETRSASTPKGLAPPAHLHARALEFEIGIDANGEPRGFTKPLGNRQRALGFVLAFEIECDTGSDSGFEFFVALARSGETHTRQIETGRPYHLQLSPGGDIETVGEIGNILKKRRKAIGFNCIIYLQAIGHCSAQFGEAPRDPLA